MLKLTAHPSREELSAYSLGQLPEERAVAIDTHISQCEPCCETIVELSSEDTFAGLLREAGRLQTDQTFESESVPDKSSAASEDIPTPLAEHSRYEIVRLIGKGGMGDVYEATHRMMERTVALKVIKHELMQKPEAVDRFHREVKAAAQLAHPNVVTAYDAEQAGDVHFLVMEYVDGVDLSRTVKDRGALPVAEACDYVRQAAVGLQYAHERGMVHRDIKPHNLMVTVDGTVKILDFGLASLARERIADADTVEIRGDLTAVGAIMGTPDFISPEQANDARQADIRSDIYSLGATLYFLLSGHPPFAEGSVMHKLKSHAQAEPKPLDSLRDDVPPELVDIVTKMTAKDPEERYLTPSQVAEALESFLRDWRQEQDQPPRPKSSSGGDMSGTGGQKPGTGDMSPEWLPVAAKWLSYVMWIPVGLLVWETVFFDASSDASDVRVIIYVVASILLSTVAGALGAAQRLNSEMDQTTRGDRRIFGMKADDAWLVAAILIGAIFAAVYFMQPNHGIVRVEVSDPSLQVSINDHNITAQNGDGMTLTIRPGEQTLIVRNHDADFEFETDRFQVQRGDEINFKVDCRNGEIVVRKDYQAFHRANMLVGSWHGKIDADTEVRLTLKANGTFEMVRLDPATPQRIQSRTTGKYVANFSAFPAQFYFDGTIIYPKIDPPSEPPNTSDDLKGEAPTMEGAERERSVKRKFAAMVDLADANTLYISDLFATSRRRMFGEEELAMHRQRVPTPREGNPQSQRKQSHLTDANTKVKQSLVRGKSPTVAVNSQPSQPKKKETAKSFRYDLSLVPSNAQLVVGARPGKILRDPRLAKLRESAPPLAGYTSLFVNENTAQMLGIELAKPGRLSNPRVAILTVDKGDAMEEVDRAVGILAPNSDEAASEYERTGYVSRHGRYLVQQIDRKTVILGTREDFNAYQAAMNSLAPNGFREVAKTMQDCEFFVIANTQGSSFFGRQQSSEYDGDDLLQILQFISGSSRFITASVSLGGTPQFQFTARARAQRLQTELAKAVTSLRDKMARIVEAMDALPDGTDSSQFWLFKNRESVAAANASLSASRVTKSTGRDTRLDIPLDPAMSTVLRTINEWFDANKAQRELAQGKLKLISRGFMKFSREHGYFPSVSTEIPGAALPVSWRVAILPYVGYEKLYAQYNLDEPWDSEHNKALLSQMPEIYRHPGSWRKSNETDVVSFVGETATGTVGEPVRLDVAFRDDPALTVLVAESASSIPWTKPDDLRFAADEPLPSIGGLRTEGWYAVFADGSLKFVPANTSIDVIAALLTRNGGEAVQFEDNKFSLMNLGGQPRTLKPGDSTPDVSPKPKE